jgi:hypothetical protein
MHPGAVARYIRGIICGAACRGRSSPQITTSTAAARLLTHCKTVGCHGSPTSHWMGRTATESRSGTARGYRGQGPEAAGRRAQWLTDLLTRRCGTGETMRDTGDAQRRLHLVSETRRNAGDGGDVRRRAHNPATTARSVTAEVTATTPHNDSPGARPLPPIARLWFHWLKSSTTHHGVLLELPAAKLGLNESARHPDWVTVVACPGGANRELGGHVLR